MARTEVSFKHGALNDEDRKNLTNLPDGNYMVTIERTPILGEPKTSYTEGPMSKDKAFLRVKESCWKYLSGKIILTPIPTLLPGAGVSGLVKRFFRG